MSPRPMPYVAVATFCEMALQSKDDVFSLIRIIDTITIKAADAVLAAARSLRCTLMLMLRAGDAIGRYEILFVLVTPTGGRVEAGRVPVEFTGEEHGVNVQFTLTLGPKDDGLYWVDILADGEKLTSVPIRIRRESVPPQKSSS